MKGGMGLERITGSCHWAASLHSEYRKEREFCQTDGNRRSEKGEEGEKNVGDGGGF